LVDQARKRQQPNPVPRRTARAFRAAARARDGRGEAEGHGKLSEEEIKAIVGILNAAGLAEAVEGLRSAPVFRITAEGLEHPQYIRFGRRAPASRLPVKSDRVRRVLQTISEAGAVRIRDLGGLTQTSRGSINALMQYLKRKELVAKAGLEFDAPYALTVQGPPFWPK
jgi:hypothetical protein